MLGIYQPIVIPSTTFSLFLSPKIYHGTLLAFSALYVVSLTNQYSQKYKYYLLFLPKLPKAIILLQV